MVKISLGLTTSTPLNKALDLAKFCEDNNFYRIWIGEDISSREIFTYTSIISMKTEKIRIATGIVSIFTRNSWQIASSSAGIQEISRNRFDLGIGVGGLDELEKLGIEVKNPYGRMKRYYYEIKEYFKIIKKPSWIKEPKIYFGSRGKLIIKLANEIAQGNIFSGPLDYLMSVVKGFKKERILWNPVFLGDKRAANTIVATMLASTPAEQIDYDRKKIEEMVKNFKKEGYADLDEKIIEMFSIYAESADELIDKIKELGRFFDEIVVGIPINKKVLEACAEICSTE